jgi:phosphoenolpyruvate carboxykinase (ATP)
MLGKRLKEHNAQVWLVNTGWSGGPYGVGSRMKLAYTREMVRAAVDGSLLKAEFEVESTFGFSIPKAVRNVPTEVLNPRNTWKDKDAYDKQAAHLSEQFAENIKKFDVPENIRNAGPKNR